MITKEAKMSDHYNTFTWYDMRTKKETGVIRKSLYLFGMLFVVALSINILIDVFEIITK